jgi:hypothetical protein
MAQKLHIGRQPDDVGLGQRGVQPGQGLLARVAPWTMSLAIMES